jgi:ParB family chromosome partitioning protein
MLIGESQEATTFDVPLDDIVPNTYQPRARFDEASLAELAESIRTVGVIQPLVVRPLAEGRFELIAGERRWRAARLAGLPAVPVVVRAAGEQAALQLALIENVQREDIAPLDCAAAFRRLIDEFGLTQEQVAEAVGKSRVAVANTLRLLRLPEEVRDGLAQGLVTEGHARALLQADSAERQIALYRDAVDKALSVREVERMARAKPREPGPKPAPGAREQRGAEAERRAIEERLSIFFGAPVKLQRAGAGGRMVVEYYSEDDLQRVLDLLGVSL